MPFARGRMVVEETDLTDKELLLRPFPPSAIRQRPGTGGRSYDYVAGGDIARRLLDATNNEFTWVIADVTLFPSETGKGYWVVRGTLTVPELGSRDGVGTASNDSVDSAKCAETDAFKRAAVRFGVALGLYEEDAAPVNGGGAQRAHAEAPIAGHRSATRINSETVRGNGNGNGNGSCPDCHAPQGRPHGTRCRLVEARS